jgi:hypothetical protein
VFTPTPSTGTDTGIDKPQRALWSKWSSSALKSCTALISMSSI